MAVLEIIVADRVWDADVAAAAAEAVRRSIANAAEQFSDFAEMSKAIGDRKQASFGPSSPMPPQRWSDGWHLAAESGRPGCPRRPPLASRICGSYFDRTQAVLPLS